MKKLVSLFHKIQSNPHVVRAEHTAWQAAAGAFVASLSATHGDIRVAVTVAVAAALAGLRQIVFPPAAP
jgi:hypothetical protein